MRVPMMAGNWKMNKTPSEAVVLTQEIANHYDKQDWENIEVVLCVPSVDFDAAKRVITFDKVKINVAAQNVYWEESGAYTGEVSVPMIKEVGCSYSIVGHSERRELFGETDEQVNKKIKALVAHDLGAIVCVGESLPLREQGETLDYVCAQLRAAFAGVIEEDAARCVIAYEPIWAIGTGRTATPEQAEEVCAALRGEFAQMYGQEMAEEVRVLYGGSVNSGNVELLLAQENIDGGLVGGASLEAKSFLTLIKACYA